MRELNEAARDRLREAGDLGKDVRVRVERGERSFAAGDRVMFLQNERGLGVKNGTLGTIEQVSERSMSVRTDDGRGISFDLKDYDRIDHGYAATIHKAQGMTVDRTHVLATPGADARGSYVALSRHRDGMDLHYGRDDFTSQDRLVNTLSRDRAKDMATDYDPAHTSPSGRSCFSAGLAVHVVDGRNPVSNDHRTWRDLGQSRMCGADRERRFFSSLSVSSPINPHPVGGRADTIKRRCWYRKPVSRPSCAIPTSVPTKWLGWGDMQ